MRVSDPQSIYQTVYSLHQVQSVHDARGRIMLLEPRHQAVLVEGMAPGNAQQQVGLAHQQQVLVLVENADLFPAVGDEVGGRCLHGDLVYT